MSKIDNDTPHHRSVDHEISPLLAGPKSHVLWEVTLPAVSKKACLQKYVENLSADYLSYIFPGGFLGDTKLCAGTEQGGKGACSVRHPASVLTIYFPVP